MIKKRGFRVPPKGTEKIRELVKIFNSCRNKKEDMFPLKYVLETIMPLAFPDFTLQVCRDEEMGEHHGLTYTKTKTIKIKESVYKGYCEDKGRDRFTIAHEIGHFIMHQGIEINFSRSELLIPAYEDSEWQADTFAAELLMPLDIALRCKTIKELADRCKVSLDAARIRLEKLAKEEKKALLQQ